MISGALAVLALAAQQVPEEVQLGSARFDTWRAAGVTQVEQRPVEGADRPLPVVREVQCRATTEGMEVHLDRRGRYALHFVGGNDEQPYSTMNVRTLRLDGVAYQAEAVQTLYLRWRFGDVAYPEREGNILPLFQGYLAVRRNASWPWMEVGTLLDELMAGRSLRIGFGRLVDGRVEPLVWQSVQLRGLREALLWCDRLIHSDRAYRLHQR